MILESYYIYAGEVMSKDFIIQKDSISLDEISSILIKSKNEEIFIVDNSNKLIGIITLKDLYEIYNSDNNVKEIKRFFYKDIVYAKPEDTLLNCRDIMLDKKIGRLPVLKDGEFVGIIRQEHIRDYLYMGIEQTGVILNYILDNIQEAICVIDSQGRVIIWNNNSEKLYGISASEIMGKYLTDYFPNAIDAKIIKTRKPVKNVFHTPKKDCHIIISSAPIYINDKFIGVVSTDRDVSEITNIQKELKKANDIVEFLEKEVSRYSDSNFGQVICKSKAMQEKIEMSKQVAKTNTSVLIIGESGTGKEVFARAIHDYSGVEGYFVPVNCSAIPTELFESEFFGYEEGAFTGAKKGGKIGLFELADNGTIFLDEIGDLPLFMQAKLLRVLQEKKIQRIGGEKLIDISARIISATNRNLERMIEKGEFREDLYYRINVIKIDIPPLRKRKEDIVLLFNHFLKNICDENNIEIPKVDSEVMDILIKYYWEGNARELKNVVEHMVVLNRRDTITKDLLPSYIKEKALNEKNIGNNTSNLDLNSSVRDLEISLIKKALEISNGNKSKAAKLLNIPRTTLHSKLNHYNID
ncbi:sigma-54 dependent transcriptional regulator PrdR [Anaerosalibacter massiliensis]|uniref:Sigma 54-interacting transcriptional regulator n=1 Tax=Anaerosalibacter massiliensis TaxID=1347392 RepID=A0A9X2MMX3_9FIRM|nr:sigma-54 dependent transcriptional regulator PrdR [Anaerosalibacter massiliensis]MCR2043986.1 sigma 54-interacting transcriptional regulator [Anaerosalibacter massiliensis]